MFSNTHKNTDIYRELEKGVLPVSAWPDREIRELLSVHGAMLLRKSFDPETDVLSLMKVARQTLAMAEAAFESAATKPSVDSEENRGG